MRGESYCHDTGLLCMAVSSAYPETGEYGVGPVQIKSLQRLKQATVHHVSSDELPLVTTDHATQ